MDEIEQQMNILPQTRIGEEAKQKYIYRLIEAHNHLRYLLIPNNIFIALAFFEVTHGNMMMFWYFITPTVVFGTTILWRAIRKGHHSNLTRRVAALEEEVASLKTTLTEHLLHSIEMDALFVRLSAVVATQAGIPKEEIDQVIAEENAKITAKLHGKN